ncbi:hypothetical protein C6P40_004177 [Pichia californica]|uniref:Endonuclease/exonuclease/phosphatase domain-containing protein n=1 Tax=Pichia californica TaxID=460514 RepID=A0A9P6WMR1_9ASCO|nr:hypothetical protein C6P40_004177 [[Candida] californica]
MSSSSSAAAAAAAASSATAALVSNLTKSIQIQKPLVPCLIHQIPDIPVPTLSYYNNYYHDSNKHSYFYNNLIENSNISSINSNNLFQHRNWFNINNVIDNSKTCTISSYNILSRHYLWESLYNYLPLDYTNWNQRFQRLNQNFNDLSKISDILCFQEMEYQVYKDYWNNQFKSIGFDSIFQKKPKPSYWKKSSNMMDGVSIFFNTSKFDLLNYEKINFANHFKHSSMFDQTFDTQSRLNIRNTVAIIAVLKHKLTGQIIFISNTHLYWSPKHDDVKLMQTYLLSNLIKNSIMRYYKISNNEIDNLIKSKNGPNIIMVGDFNSNPSSMVYKYMLNGSINRNQEPNFIQDYGIPFSQSINNCLGNFKSPYTNLYNNGKFTKTTYTPKFKDVIDYIWFADDNKNFKFTKVLGDIDSQYLKNFNGFPNKDFPSDHIPIVSQIEFN